MYEERQQVADSTKQTAEQEALTPNALAALPTEWVAKLRQGVEEVDIDLLSSAIKQIRGHDAELANALARLAEDFEYDEILVLIQHAEEQH